MGSVESAIAMIALRPSRPIDRVLAIGAHADDIEIGCLGTLTRLRPSKGIHLIIVSSDAGRAAEARASARRAFGEHATVTMGAFPDGFLPYHAAEVKQFLREATDGEAPDVVFSPARGDLHQDHRFLAELALQLFRDHLILEYEIPKYDADLGRPNLYVPLSSDEMRAKVDHLMASFDSQRDKDWYREDVFRAVAALRGLECRAPDGFAEAFYAGKAVLA